MKKEESIPEMLERDLPELIDYVARENHVLEYRQNPDLVEKRLNAWHQFGLLTHTKMVRQVFLNELEGILTSWGLYDQVKEVLDEEVSGIRKGKLLEASMPLHDLGKIVVLGDDRVDREHEAISRDLIYEDYFMKKLTRLGLGRAHIDYLAECIASHDVVGKQIRDPFKHEGNLRLSYLSKKEALKRCKEISSKYQNNTEIGVYFICDLLGKTDIRLDAQDDESILRQEQEIERILREKELAPQLKKAVMQLPVNLKLAEIYLKSV